MTSRKSLALLMSGLLSACAGTGAGSDSSSAAKAGGSQGKGTGMGTGAQAELNACPPPPAPGIFDNALCVCGDFQETGRGLVTQGLVGGAAASVGVNGSSTMTGSSEVDGDFVSYLGMSGAGQVHVTRDFVTRGNLVGAGNLDVGGDLFVGGDIRAVGQLKVDGTLRLAGTEQFVGRES